MAPIITGIAVFTVITVMEWSCHYSVITTAVSVNGLYVHPAATMVMTMDVEVEELWRKAVEMTPIMRPHTGFCINGLLNALFAALPEIHISIKITN